MRIYGLQKMTLLDFPGHVACTVFLGGCDFRCPFCHNYELVDGTAEPVMEDFYEIRVGEKGAKLDVDRAVFDDREKFEDISEKVRNEIYEDYRVKREQEDKEYRDYLFRQHFWILFPQNSTYKYVKALIAGLIAAAIGSFFYKLKKERYLVLNIAYFLMTGFKVAVLVYVLMFPATCA